MPPYDYFAEGRRQAGAGWYRPTLGGWLAVAGPTLIGAAEGARAGLSSRAAMGKGPGPTSGAGAPTLGETLGPVQSDPTTERFARAWDMPQPQPQPGPVTQSPLEDRFANVWNYDPSMTGAPAPGPTPAPAARPTVNVPGIGAVDREKINAIMRAIRMSQGGSYYVSSRELKANIEAADDRRSLGEVMATPVYTYKYKNDGPGDPGRIGPMAEEVPRSWQTTVNGRAGIKMPPYLGALHAATRALARDVQTLKERLRG